MKISVRNSENSTHSPEPAVVVEDVSAVSSRITVVNGKTLKVPGVQGECTFVDKHGARNLAFKPESREPYFKTGFEFSLDDVNWRVARLFLGNPDMTVAELELMTNG